MHSTDVGRELTIVITNEAISLVEHDADGEDVEQDGERINPVSTDDAPVEVKQTDHHNKFGIW